MKKTINVKAHQVLSYSFKPKCACILYMLYENDVFWNKEVDKLKKTMAVSQNGK